MRHITFNLTLDKQIERSNHGELTIGKNISEHLFLQDLICREPLY